MKGYVSDQQLRMGVGVKARFGLKFDIRGTLQLARNDAIRGVVVGDDVYFLIADIDAWVAREFGRPHKPSLPARAWAWLVGMR